MKLRISIIILMFACKICNSQNLVPNGDFEQFITCPNNTTLTNYAMFWINPSTNNPGTSGTSDYYNACSTGNIASVPINNPGYQFAHSGNGYCGLITWFGAGEQNYREYIEVPLTSVLVKGTCYHFEMFVCLAECSRRSTDAIQVYFSDTLISGIANYLPLPFVPQIVNTTGLITDTFNWTSISGNYTAEGGENHLIIGNFEYDSTIIIQPTGFGWLWESYYYIDDVSLSICTDIDEKINNIIFEIYPNPFSDNLSLKINNNELLEIVLYDFAMRKTFQEKFNNSITINTSRLTKGFYFYEIHGRNGLLKKGKLIKQ